MQKLKIEKENTTLSVIGVGVIRGTLNIVFLFSGLDLRLRVYTGVHFFIYDFWLPLRYSLTFMYLI